MRWVLRSGPGEDQDRKRGSQKPQTHLSSVSSSSCGTVPALGVRAPPSPSLSSLLSLSLPSLSSLLLLASSALSAPYGPNRSTTPSRSARAAHDVRAWCFVWNEGDATVMRRGAGGEGKSAVGGKVRVRVQERGGGPEEPARAREGASSFEG